MAQQAGLLASQGQGMGGTSKIILMIPTAIKASNGIITPRQHLQPVLMFTIHRLQRNKEGKMMRPTATTILQVATHMFMRKLLQGVVASQREEGIIMMVTLLWIMVAITKKQLLQAQNPLLLSLMWDVSMVLQWKDSDLQ
jgi:hypothetical protein